MMDGFLPIAEAPARERTPDAPELAPGPRAGLAVRSLWARLRSWRPFLALVVAPTLLAAIYVGLIAAPQYQSEAHFIVRTAAPTAGAPSGLGALLGLGGASPGQGETRSVEDYLVSHDAVAALQRTIDVTAVFRRPEADWFSRLGGGPLPAPETVLKAYRRHVRVTSASDTGISVLTVRAFRPQDARAMAETLLKLGEARVNTFNQRALEDSLSVARGQLAEAEAAVAKSEGSVTSFRQARTDIDPERSSAAAISLSSTLEGQLARLVRGPRPAHRTPVPRLDRRGLRHLADGHGGGAVASPVRRLHQERKLRGAEDAGRGHAGRGATGPPSPGGRRRCRR